MKTFIVTGAGSGLGKEIALGLARENYHILLTGRTANKLAGVKAEIIDAGGSADVLSFDVSHPDQAQKGLDSIQKEHPIYGLVNNAGVGHFGAFEGLTTEEIKEMLDTNVLGTILMTKTILPMLLEKDEGHILNVISTAGLRPKVNESVYVASKFAIRGFTESLQKEYSDSNVRFTAVYMGGMNTPFWDHSDHVSDPSRFWTAKEVASMIIQDKHQDSIIIESKKSPNK